MRVTGLDSAGVLSVEPGGQAGTSVKNDCKSVSSPVNFPRGFPEHINKHDLIQQFVLRRLFLWKKTVKFYCINEDTREKTDAEN